MQLDAKASSPAANAVKKAAPAGSRPGTPSGKKNAETEFIPEIDIYLTLLVIVYLLDQKQTEKVGDAGPPSEVVYKGRH